MLELSTALRPASEDVVAKVMDGEAVIINLETGTYYSADGAGGFAWTLIAKGLRLEDAARHIEARYDVSREDACVDLLRFAAELVREGLVSPADEAAVVDEIDPGAGELPYASPQLQVYRDMEELLALDPPTPGLADLRWKG